MRQNTYRIHQIKIGMNESKGDIPRKIIQRIGNKNLILTDVEIVKESIDARDKKDIKFVYSVDFRAVTRQNPRQYVNIPKTKKNGLEDAPDMRYQEVSAGDKELKHRPVIVGFGPCGMFAGLILAKRGYAPVILERGNQVEQRVEDVENFWKNGILNTESNVQFGEGGAGTFSDGKLTTGIKDVRIRKVLEEFVKAGAPEDILYKQKPHIGTDVLRTVVKNIREEIITNGGEIHFGAKLTELMVKDRTVTGVVYQQNGERHTLETEDVILAIGHSARDTFRYLYEKGVKMNPKPFSIGVRIEHPQSVIDRAQYGDTKGLPPAEYKLSHRCENGRGVYTFCMCPGGEVVIASSQEGGVVTNGMSNRGRDSGTANSALLVDVRVEDFDSTHPLAGIDFQEKYERAAFINAGKQYKAPTSTWGELRDGAAPQVENSLPEFAVAALREAMPHLGRKLKGFDADDAKVSAVETRSSSPVRILRGKDGESLSAKGLYPCGEGAGYAGGITSAAVDGIKIAEAVIEKYK